LPLPSETWRTPYEKLATEIGLDPDIDAGFTLAAAFLDPILRGSAPAEARWRPELGSWQPIEQPCYKGN
jgi:hypothetical protein